MTTPAQHSALRLALRSMVADLTYPDAAASRPWVQAQLDRAAWTDTITAGLTTLAIRWAKTQGETPWLALRKALGEELTKEEQTALSRPGRRDSLTPYTGTPTVERGAEMSIATLTEETTIMTPEFERELAIVTKEFERPPYWFPRKMKPLEDAQKLVAAAKVHADVEGIYHVDGSKGAVYTCVPGKSCTCPDSTTYGDSLWCKHLIAVDLQREVEARVQPALFASPKTVDERLATPPTQETAVEAPRSPQEPSTVAPIPEEASIPEPALEAQEEPQVPPDTPPIVSKKRVRPTIPARYITIIKGKQHVQFAGLVVAAQEDGLTFLAADWTANEPELSLAHAVAKFVDGRQYEESGDATPGNVTPMVKPHFRRVALTRAKARCLRDALGIEECSVEELETEEDDRPTPDMTRPPAPDALLKEIKIHMKNLGFTGTTQGQARKQIHTWTGLDFEPSNYQQIVALLKDRRVQRKEAR